MLLLIKAPLQSFEIFYFSLTKWLLLVLHIIIFLLLAFLSFSQENDKHEHYLAYEFISVYFHLFLYFETWLSLCELGSFCPVPTQQSKYTTDNCSVSLHIFHLGNSVTYSYFYHLAFARVPLRLILKMGMITSILEVVGTNKWRPFCANTM